MGSIRPRYIKSAAKSLMSKYPETFTNDFETNKRLVEQLTNVTTKKVRNRIAGYLVRLVKIAVAREEAEAAITGEQPPEDDEY